jgi:hypothetical protein
VIRLDLPGGQVELRRDDVVCLRDAAAAQTGRSSTARDLSLLLDRALDGGSRVVLRRGELHALAELADEAGLADVAERLGD